MTSTIMYTWPDAVLRDTSPLACPIFIISLLLFTSHKNIPSRSALAFYPIPSTSIPLKRRPPTINITSNSMHAQHLFIGCSLAVLSQDP